MTLIDATLFTLAPKIQSILSQPNRLGECTWLLLLHFLSSNNCKQTAACVYNDIYTYHLVDESQYTVNICVLLYYVSVDEVKYIFMTKTIGFSNLRCYITSIM